MFYNNFELKNFELIDNIPEEHPREINLSDEPSEEPLTKSAARSAAPEAENKASQSPRPS